MRGLLALLLLSASLAGCIAGDGGIEAGSGIDGAGGQSRQTTPVLLPHEEPVREEGDVEVEPQGDRYKATRTVTVTNGAGPDTKRLHITQQTTNGGMSAHARDQGHYLLTAVLFAYGDTEQQARDNLQGIDVRHTDNLDSETLTLDTRVVMRQTNGLPIQLPDVGNERGGSLNLAVPVNLESATSMAGVNGGVAIDGLTGPSADVEITNGGITVQGAFDNLDLSCTNGGTDIRADRYSEGDGSWRARCTNGGFDVQVVSGPDRGFDVTADITNGGIDISLPDTEDVGQQSDRSRHVRTSDYEDRAYRTVIDLDGTNGGISVRD